MQASRFVALIAPTVVGVVTATAYTILSALQWTSYTVLSWDLGIFTQLARAYASLQAPIVPIKGEGFNLLGDHFHPLLVALGPIYAIFPSAFTLLVVQNLLFGLSAAVITVAATRQLGTIWGPLIGLAFGLSWGLQGAAEAQFHEIAFAVPLLAFSLSYFLRSRWLASALWAAPLVFVKEDLGLTVLVMGLVLALRMRSVNHRHALQVGLGLAAWGLVWFVLASLVILPALNPNGSWAYPSSIDPLALLSNPLSLFQPEKGMTLWLMLIITGAIALRSPLVLIVLPTIAWRFLSGNEGYWGHTWQYSAVLMPVLFAAALDGIARARATSQTDGPAHLLARYSRYAPAVMVTAALTLLPTMPVAKLFDPSTHFATNAAGADEALEMIPDDAVVETDIGLMSYLVDRTTVYYLGNPNPVPEYLVVDLAGGGLPAQWSSVEVVAETLHPDATFTTIYTDGRYQVAERTN